MESDKKQHELIIIIIMLHLKLFNNKQNNEYIHTNRNSNIFFFNITPVILGGHISVLVWPETTSPRLSDNRIINVGLYQLGRYRVCLVRSSEGSVHVYVGILETSQIDSRHEHT